MIHVIGVVKNRDDADKAIKRLAEFSIKVTPIQNGTDFELTIGNFSDFCMATSIFDAMDFNEEFR